MTSSLVPASSARRFLPAFAVVVLALLLPATGGATMPGANGRIAFEKAVKVSESDFNYGIWSVNPDGSGPLEVAGGEKSPGDGAYSPDGSRLAFDYYDELWIAAADGSGAHSLAPGNDHTKKVSRWAHNYEDPDTHNHYTWVRIDEEVEERDAYSEPSFSPSGATLAVMHYTGAYASGSVCETSNSGQPCTSGYFYNFTECRNCGASIDAIDSTTGAPLGTLVPRSVEPQLTRPTYASTGALAYQQFPVPEYNNGQIRLVPTPGAGAVTLVSGAVGEPDFSPDGGRVAFASGRHEIGVVPVSGGTPTIFTAPPPPESSGYSALSPIWSPDGTLIAFGDVGAKGFEIYSEGGIYLVHPDGSGLVPIQGDASIPSSWQPLALASPPPPAPVAAPPVRAHAIKGKKRLRLSRKDLAVAGRVACGSSPCGLKVTAAKLKVGKRRFGVKATVLGKLAAGATTAVKVRVKGKALAALEGKGKGALTIAVGVNDSAGAERLAFAARLLPPKHRPH